MPMLARPLLTEALDPAVVAFRCDEDNFVLRDDLEHLDRVRSVGATEAVVLYCTRILEVMVRHLLRPYYRPSEQVARNLNLLHEYCALPMPLKRWFDRLREMGNDARHVQRPLTDDDAEVAFVILLRWLHWYFCEYPFGAFSRVLTVNNRPLDTLLPGELVQLIERLDRPEAPEGSFLDALRLSDRDSLINLTPVLPAVLVEILLGRNRLEEAQAVLRPARNRFNRNLRLNQLEGLYWSRRFDNDKDVQHLHRAREWLERLPATGSPADEETHGILAGVYKRLSGAEPAKEREWLSRCRDTYQRGWDLSQQTNTYLGINAASTALWLAQDADAAHLARTVRQALEALATQLRDAPGKPQLLTYWDQATLAEACLLQRDLKRAGELYQDAFTRFPQNAADHAVTRNQARRILKQLGLEDQADAVLGPEQPSAEV